MAGKKRKGVAKSMPKSVGMPMMMPTVRKAPKARMPKAVKRPKMPKVRAR